ncbi:MAG: hypothetical protein Q4D53_08310 [Leptotrichiaceae bacterium]|nr:hypothetical protein [Leptotrichiaceae bacterium]
MSFETSHTGLADAKFKVKEIGLSKNSTWIDIGILTEVIPTFSWCANYDGKIEKKGNNNIFTTGIRFSF